MQGYKNGPGSRMNWKGKLRLEGEEYLTDCHIIDMDDQRMKVCLSGKLPVDTNIKVGVVLSSDYIVNAQAWVTWQKTSEGLHTYELYFTKISDTEKEKISRFLKVHAPDVAEEPTMSIMGEKGGEGMADNRTFARVAAQFPLKFLDLDKNAEGYADVRDISAKGVGIVTTAPLRTKAPLELWLDIPDGGEPLYTRGEVVWLRPQAGNEYRAGITLEKADLMGVARVLRSQQSL